MRRSSPADGLSASTKKARSGGWERSRLLCSAPPARSTRNSTARPGSRCRRSRFSGDETALRGAPSGARITVRSLDKGPSGERIVGTPLNVDGPLSPCFSVGAAPLHSDPPPLRLPMGLLDNRKAIENELAIINDPLTAEERPAIVELVAQLHVATGVDDFFDLHTKLLV